MYMTIQKVIFYVFKRHKSWRNSEDVFTVHSCEWKPDLKGQKNKNRLILIVNVLMLLQYLHLPNLNAASSVVWQKVLWPPKRENRRGVISWTYFSDDLTELFISLFICTCKLKILPVLSFWVLTRRNVIAEVYIIYIMCLECILQTLSVHTI